MEEVPEDRRSSILGGKLCTSFTTCHLDLNKINREITN